MSDITKVDDEDIFISDSHPESATWTSTERINISDSANRPDIYRNLYPCDKTEFKSFEVTINGVKDDDCNIPRGKPNEAHAATGLDFFEQLRAAIKAAPGDDKVCVVETQGIGDNSFI